MHFGDEAIAEAVRLIKAGNPVAVPTETVYGLAGDATSASAVAAIYAAKGRPGHNPLIVHVTDLDHALALGGFSAVGLALANQHWPGPLTIVVPLRSDANIPAVTTAGLPTVALRVPNHRAMQAILASTGLPLAAPSANSSGTITPTRAQHVLRTLEGKIPLIVDDGQTAGGVESTIIKVEGTAVHLLRHGPILIEGAIHVENAPIEAPGQLTAHYAPSKHVRLNAVTSRTNEWHLGFGNIAGDTSLSSRGDLIEAASRLFDLLHAADASSVERIAIAPIPETGVGLAINDRLRRAAAGAP